MAWLAHCSGINPIGRIASLPRGPRKSLANYHPAVQQRGRRDSVDTPRERIQRPCCSSARVAPVSAASVSVMSAVGMAAR